MKSYRFYLILSFVLLTASGGCGLVISSHHQTEDYTPAFAAATSGDLATVQEAIHKDPAIIKSKEWDDDTLLHDAVGHNQLAMAQFLLDHGADVNAKTKGNITPLHMAAQNNEIEIIKLLMKRGAKINALDSKGWTPLDRAEKWGHPDAATFLKKNGGHEGASQHE
jgi:ankyrin repeat protein